LRVQRARRRDDTQAALAHAAPLPHPHAQRRFAASPHNKALLHGVATDQWTPIVFAAKEGHTAIVKFLVHENGVAPTPCGESVLSHTALRGAAIGGHAKTVAFLLNECGVDVDVLSGGRRTALMAAAYYGCVVGVSERERERERERKRKRSAGRVPRFTVPVWCTVCTFQR